MKAILIAALLAGAAAPSAAQHAGHGAPAQPAPTADPRCPPEHAGDAPPRPRRFLSGTKQNAITAPASAKQPPAMKATLPSPNGHSWPAPHPTSSSVPPPGWRPANVASTIR